jgi:hypothetical protein
METVELLKLDMANYTIQQMRPYIQQQVVAYEQKKFKELLETQKGFLIHIAYLNQPNFYFFSTINTNRKRS